MAGQFVTWAWVAEQYEGDLPDELWVERLIERAERRLIAERPSIPARVAAGTLPVDNVRDAVASAVLRVVRNPHGIITESEGSYSYSLDRAAAAAVVYFTGDDLALIDSHSAVAAPDTAAAIPVAIPAYRVWM